MRTLFICVGNVGRSQIAEGLFRKYYPHEKALSAGIKISGPEQPIGQLMPNIKEVLDVMKEENIDISMAKRKQLTPKMVRNSGRIIVIIDEKVELPDYLVQSPNVFRWNIADPKGKDLAFTRNVKNMIKEQVRNLN